MENFTITHIGDYELLQPMPFIFIPAKGKEFTSELNGEKGIFVDDFFIAAYPCTQEFWREVINLYNKYKPPEALVLEEKIIAVKIEKNKIVKSQQFEKAAEIREYEKKLQNELASLIPMELNPKPSRFSGDTKPVEQVNWYELQAFIETLNALLEKQQLKHILKDQTLNPIEVRGSFTLPSEAQWQYAAIGGERQENFEFAGTNYLPDVGWFKENSKETMPVGLKQPNAFMLYDLCGNVWEWCGNEYAKLPLDGSAGSDELQSKSVRGGSYWRRARYCRVRDRYIDRPDDRDSGIGFRLLFSPSSSTA